MDPDDISADAMNVDSKISMSTHLWSTVISLEWVKLELANFVLR